MAVPTENRSGKAFAFIALGYGDWDVGSWRCGDEDARGWDVGWDVDWDGNGEIAVLVVIEDGDGWGHN